MKKLHAKSPCCHSRIYHYGHRRKQCSSCHITWRIRLKKKGRKKKRETNQLFINYLHHRVPSFYAQSYRQKKRKGKLKARLIRSRNFFNAHTPWPEIPQEDQVILVADAMVKYIEQSWHAVYFVLVRSLNHHQAILLPPTIIKGTESQRGWKQTFDQLPQELQSRITGLVSDGQRGLVYYAKQHGWIIQRCHFHIIARIQGRRSKWKRSRHRDEGQRIYDLVREVLHTSDTQVLIDCLNQIKILRDQTTSTQLRVTLSGFLKHYEDFRSYLKYPGLHLPQTSNAAESLIGSFRDLCYRAKGFRTLSSFSQWLEAFVKYRKGITCNGTNQPN